MSKLEITGIGCITPWGDTAFSLNNGSVTKDKNMINQVKEFNIKEYIVKKGLRTLQKSTQMAIASTQLAIEDAGYNQEDWNSERVGVFVGNSMSYLNNIMDFLDDAYVDGAGLVSPIKFPNTVLNNISGWVSIVFDAKGVNTTVNSGNTSGVDALLLAKNYIDNGIIDTAIVVGVEAIDVGILHNESNFELVDQKMTEASISLVLEKSEFQSKKVYGHLDNVYSWQEHTYNEESYINNLNKRIAKINLNSIEEFYFGSYNKLDKVTEKEIRLKYGKEINGYNTSLQIGKTFAVSGLIKIVLSLFNEGKKLIIETNETGNQSVISIMAKGMDEYNV